MNQVKFNFEKIFVKYTQLFSFFLSFSLIFLSAQDKKANTYEASTFYQEEIITGADQHDQYLPLLAGRKVGIVTNQTGITFIKTIHNGSLRTDTLSIVDFLLSKEIQITKIFSPEHGFRGNADAGEQIKDGKDPKTGIKIISLYGNNKKPSREQVKGIDILLFDIQDVGVRFYTYISTLHYVMEAAAENKIPVIVLDRPNPNGHYVDGPVLEEGFQSFIGMHKVPVVYGMTLGEYARMINGERWLKSGLQCELTVIPLKNYTHSGKYSLPVFPSPNLKTDHAINLYPSVCFFEGTNVSEGRGTNSPFEIYGSPYITTYDFEFIPHPNHGSKNPKYAGQTCYGKDLRNEPYLSEIKLEWLLAAYANNSKAPFFLENLFFDKLAGTDKLRKQIIAGRSEKEIKYSWKSDLEEFKKIRIKYLLYP
ncbi:MAG: DUF1343 domain-containing protein [Flavobacteriaceae bacterium]|jgi:uncharacterized protein YbbC (DUF1343 family)|nr:DUF1343 domain-containing protein [Flavobacteriaceae bacterium]